MDYFARMLDALAEEKQTLETLSASRKTQRRLNEQLGQYLVQAGAPVMYKAALAAREAKLRDRVHALARSIDSKLAYAQFVSYHAEAVEERTRIGIADVDLEALKERALCAQREYRRLYNAKYALETELYEAEQHWKRISHSARVCTRQNQLKRLNASYQTPRVDTPATEHDSGSQ